MSMQIRQSFGVYYDIDRYIKYAKSLIKTIEPKMMYYNCDINTCLLFNILDNENDVGITSLYSLSQVYNDIILDTKHFTELKNVTEELECSIKHDHSAFKKCSSCKNCIIDTRGSVHCLSCNRRYCNDSNCLFDFCDESYPCDSDQLSRGWKCERDSNGVFIVPIDIGCDNCNYE